MIIEKTYQKNFGPKWHYAKAKVEIKPSTNSFSVLYPEIKNHQMLTYMMALGRRLTDMLGSVSVTILEIEEHEVDSCRAAFDILGIEIAKEYIARNQKVKLL